MSTRSRVRGRAALLGLALSLLIVGSGPSSAALAQEQQHVVLLYTKEFQPKVITIGIGDSVQWVHQDPVIPHTVTAADGSFDSHPRCENERQLVFCMNPGNGFVRTFEEVGTYHYYCKLHGAPSGEGMAGTVVVTENPPPPTEATEEPRDDDTVVLEEPEDSETRAQSDQNPDGDDPGSLPIPTLLVALLALLAVGGGSWLIRRRGSQTPKPPR